MILTFQNQKGGVGKTTLSLHVAHHLALSGARVLLIDADPQGSARDWLAARETSAPFTVVGLDRPTIHRDISSPSWGSTVRRSTVTSRSWVGTTMWW
jgi:chromosome partitioning protein